MDYAHTAENVEETVRDTARASASAAREKVAEFGNAAADSYNRAADYLRNHDLRDIAAELNDFVKTHPAQALIGAAAVGFMAATLLRRR